MKKKILCLCSCLHCNPLSFQIRKCLDFALIFYNYHLAAVQVWTCPLIFVFSSIHGIAAPQTVYCSICQKFILIFPDYILKLWLISQPLKCFLSKFHINTFIFAITCLITVRFKIIHSNNNLRQFTISRFLFLYSTSSQHKTASQKKCSNTNSVSSGTGAILSILSHILFLNFRYLFYMYYFSCFLIISANIDSNLSTWIGFAI